MKTQEEIDEIARLQLKRARTTATVFGALAIIALIAFVYAFILDEKVEKYRAENAEHKEMLMNCEKRAEVREQELVNSIKKLQETVDVMMAIQASRK